MAPRGTSGRDASESRIFFAAHTLSPIGEAGIKVLPNEEAVVKALRDNIKEPALYLFPGVDPKASPEERQAAMERYRHGPSGILVYRPGGRDMLSARMLGTELLSNILAALLAGLLLSKALSGLGNLFGKAAYVAGMGLIASVAIDLPYWNWYAFPTSYFVAQTVDQVVGFFVAGVALAFFVKKPRLIRRGPPPPPCVQSIGRTTRK